MTSSEQAAGPGTTSECVVVGGGPGGLLLTYLLARAGLPVTLLESHRDFDRDFRGDSLHPYTLEMLDTLGLADRLLALPHSRARYFRFHTPRGTIIPTDYGQLPTRFNFVALMPQSRFLAFLADRVREINPDAIRLGAKVTGLTRDAGGRVQGVRYRDDTGTRECGAELVVGADGRFSRMRRLADLPASSLGAAGDLLWFRLPRYDTDPPNADAELHFGRDHYVGVLGGVDTWQIGYTLPRGGYAAAREAGTAPIREFVATHVPWLADRVHLLTDFAQTTLLSVEIARVDSWHRPGLLLIGDAAHVISPVGGNGILMAIQDAVAAANRLIPALRRGSVTEADLAAIVAVREPAIRTVQAQQVRVEQQAARARAAGRSLAPPAALRFITALPGMRRRAARANGYGPRPPFVDLALLTDSAAAGR